MLETDKLDREVRLLAEALAIRHGDIHVAMEASGLHLYMAAPCELEASGLKELRDRHLAVNADKYLRRGRYRGNPDGDRCASCMKCGSGYTVQGLLAYDTLARRGINVKAGLVKVHQTEKRLIDDGRGNMIPEHPGQCTPLTQLPDDHPAIWYLRNRGYRPNVLEAQFRAAWCHTETPEDAERGVRYRRMPQGFNDTAQGRIVFFGDINGVQKIWQARILDHVEASTGVKYYWHPYRQEWTACEQKDSATGKFVLLPEFLDSCFDWSPSKYRTSPGGSRRECVLGYDAAVRWNASMKLRKPVAVCMEGPLDAGRCGAPCMPILGKFMGEEQARLLAKRFRRLIYVADNDAAGKKAADSVERAAGALMEVEILTLPKKWKDFGEMPEAEAWKILGPVIFR